MPTTDNPGLCGGREAFTASGGALEHFFEGSEGVDPPAWTQMRIRSPVWTPIHRLPPVVFELAALAEVYRGVTDGLPTILPEPRKPGRIQARNAHSAVRVRPELLPSKHVALKSRGRTIWRSYFSFGGAWPEGSAVPLPSTKDTNRSPGPPGNCSSRPLGQRTSMRSNESAEPSPKWRRGSLVER